MRCDCRRERSASSAAVPRAKLSSRVLRARINLGIDAIKTEGGGCVRRRYSILEERNSSRNPTLEC